MRAKLIVAAVAALAVAALGATQVPGKAPSKPPLNFTLNGKIKTVSFVDNAPDGDSVGDVVVFTQTLRNLRGKVVGSDHATCTKSLPAGHRVCSGGFLLARGQLTIQGIDPPDSVKRHPLIVTGGSGAYRGVRGEIDVRHLSPIEDRFVFHLKR